MTRTMRILTLLMLAIVVGTGQVWATEPVADLGYIVFDDNEVTGKGEVAFYTDAECTQQINFNNGKTDRLSSNVMNEEVDGNNFLGYTIYIKAVPNYNYTFGAADDNGAVTFITAEKTTNVFQAPRRSSPDPTLNLGPDITVTATDERYVYSFVMPANGANVTVHVNFPEKPKNTAAVSYIDAGGTTKTLAANTAYIIDGTESKMGTSNTDTWYVCNSNLTYTTGLTLNGNVHLILVDGCTMSVGTSESRINGMGISSFSAESLTIYGQSTGNGVLSVYNTGDYVEGIRTYDLTINGGHIIADTNGYSSYALSNFGYDFTINGGTVSAIATGTDTHAIYATRNFYYNGGIVNANATSGYAIYANNSDCNLNWRNPDDRIFIGSTGVFFNTEGYTVKTATGQRFVAYNMANESDISASAIVSGTVDDVSTLADKTLKPLDGNYVSINTADFTFSGTTSTTSPFTITTGSGENETTTHYYIYKSNDPATLSYTGNDFVQVTGLPEGTTLAAVTNEPMQRTFTMPATDVVLTATAMALTATPVAYDGTARTPEIKQGDDVFDAANYAIAYQLGEEAVSEAKNVNTYTCTLTGLGQYVGTTTVPFAITKRTTSLAVEIVDPVTTIDGHPVLIAGDDAHVKVTLVPVKGENETTELPAMNGIVTISVDNGTNNPKSYTVAIVNGVGHYYVANLAQDAYAITASFAGDANHAASTSDPNYSIAVSNVKTALRICFDKTDMTANTKVVTVGEPVTVYVDLYTVPSDWDGDFAKASPFNSDAVVTVKCNPTWQTGNVGNYTLGLVNGHGSITFSHLPADECDYYINAVYAGDDIFTDYQTKLNNQTLTLKVNKTATTVGVEVTSPVIAK